MKLTFFVIIIALLFVAGYFVMQNATSSGVPISEPPSDLRPIEHSRSNTFSEAIIWSPSGNSASRFAFTYLLTCHIPREGGMAIFVANNLRLQRNENTPTDEISQAQMLPMRSKFPAYVKNIDWWTPPSRSQIIKDADCFWGTSNDLSVNSVYFNDKLYYMKTGSRELPKDYKWLRLPVKE